MSSAFKEKKTGDRGDDGQRYDTGGRLSFAPESLLSAPPSPLYILKCCLQVSEGHHQKKDVFILSICDVSLQPIASFFTVKNVTISDNRISE